MVTTSRGILAIGLSVAGLAMLVGQTVGQGPQQDGAVRKAATPATNKPPAPVAAYVGSVDLELVFKSYEKVKVSNKEYSAALLARKNELMKIMSEAQEEAQMLSKLAPGSPDYKKHEDRVTELKARHEAGREQAEREFAQKQAEAMATLYKEIQEMVKKIAQWRNLNYVVKVSNQPITGADPNSVMAAISSTVVYCDPRNDITNDVIYNLNRYYKATAMPASTKNATGMPNSGQPGGAGNTQAGGN